MKTLPMTPRCKMVAEAAAKVADDLGHSYVGTEHLLIAIARVGEGTAARVLLRAGLTESALRDAVLRLTNATEPGLVDVIQELQSEIKALREEIRAKR